MRGVDNQISNWKGFSSKFAIFSVQFEMHVDLNMYILVGLNFFESKILLPTTRIFDIDGKDSYNL